MDSTIPDDFIEWAYQPFGYSFSAGCLAEPTNTSSPLSMPSNDLFNDEYMQYFNHPSSVSSSLTHHLQQQQPSPIEEEGDDDDSLDFSITTPHPFYFPVAVDSSKENQISSTFFSYPAMHNANVSTMTLSTLTTPSASSSSSLSSLSSNSLSTHTDWTSNFPGSSIPPASTIPRSYVSLSDVNAFVAKADSIKHSASVHSHMSVLNHQESSLPETSLSSSSPPSWYDYLPSSSAPFPPSSSPQSSSSSSSLPCSPTATSTLSIPGQKLWIKLPKNSPILSEDNPFETDARSSLRSPSFNNEVEDYEDIYQENDEEDSDDDDYGYFEMPASQKAYPTSRRRRQPGNRRKGTSKSKHHHKSNYMMQKSIAMIKKGRNVDKACNHCKRSHLRCDEMRPCRRCITTGKTGCKDVQHKPRGRPKLNKK